MKTGYSILLGEYIDANALEHRDCEPFQIVCPECYEPLFKVERDSQAKKSDYLSHYRQTTAFQSQCELRVSSKSNSERQKHNSESRDQKLDFFLKVFAAALGKDPYFGYGKSITHSHKIINKSKALSVFKRQHFDTARKTGWLHDFSNFSEAAEFYVSESGSFGETPATGFSLSTQIRIASDIMKLLLTEPGRKNYEMLFNHAAIYLLNRCTNPASDATAEDVEVLNSVAYFVTGLMQGGKRRGMAVLDEMAHTPIYPPFTERPATYLLKVAAEIAHEMLGVLIRLPYFDLLRQRHDETSKNST